MQSTQQVLAKLYQSKDVIDFISKQIQQLLYSPSIKPIRKYISLSFNLPSKTDAYHFKIQSKSIEFMVVLGKGYPYTAPRVHIKTSILSPGFDDCRDLLYEILDIEEWDFKITLKHIQQKIIVFLSNLKHNQDIFYVSRIGQFHLNAVYPVDLIKQLRVNQLLFAFQYDSSNALKMYIVDVSMTHIVLFLTKQQPQLQGNTYKIPHQNQITSCMIYFYAELGSIQEMAVDRQNFSNIQLKFSSKKPHNMHMNTTTIIKKLKMRKGISFVKKIIKNISFFGITDVKMDLNPEKMQIQQKQFLSKIDQAQKQLQHKFNSETVKQLNKSYQSMVQYYSSHDIPYFEVYIEKITNLYERPDVQLILNAEDNENQIKQTIQIANKDMVQNSNINQHSKSP